MSMSASARGARRCGPATSLMDTSTSMAPIEPEGTPAYDEGCWAAGPAPRAGLPVILVSAVALIDADGRVLLAQRPEGKSMAGLWEFPGGKIEAGGRPEGKPIPELWGGFGIVVKEACPAPPSFASHPHPDFHFLIPPYVCPRW